MDIANFKRNFEKGTTIIKDGDEANETFILLSGEVNIIKGDKIIATIDKSGSFIGELAALLNEKRSADVITTQDSEFIVVTNNDFKKLLTLDPDIGVKLVKSLAQRLKETTDRLI